MIGVARFVRTGPSVAEPAVAVADDWQSRGVGTALLEALARRALAEGIEVFSGPVLSDNPAPLRVLDQVGDVSVQHVGGVGQVDVLLRPADPTGGRVRRLRALLRAIAASTIEPGLGAWQRLLPRPSVGLDEPHSNVIVAIVEPSAGAASASAAATVAGELARAWAASVVMVGTAAARDADADAERLLRVAARLEASGTPATYVIARGDVGAAALRVAADRRARLVVVEDRADGAGKPLSATWDFLTHHAPCSVLVTRGPVG
jgi:hypothetical protein